MFDSLQLRGKQDIRKFRRQFKLPEKGRNIISPLRNMQSYDNACGPVAYLYCGAVSRMLHTRTEKHPRDLMDCLPPSVASAVRGRSLEEEMRSFVSHPPSSFLKKL